MPRDARPVLAVMETAAHVEAAAGALSAAAGRMVVVGLTPSAWYRAQRLGLAAHSTLPYLDTGAHRELSAASAHMSSWVERAAEIATEPPELAEAVHTLVNLWMRFAINYCLWVLEVGARALDTVQPREVWVPDTRRRRPWLPGYPERGLTIAPEDGVCPLLVRRLAQQRGVPYRVLRESRAADGAVRSRGDRPGWLLALRTLHAGLQGMAWARRGASAQPAVLFTSGVAPMRRLAERVQAGTGWEPCYLPESAIPTAGWAALRRGWTGVFAPAMRRQLAQWEVWFDRVRAAEGLLRHRDAVFADCVADHARDGVVPYLVGLQQWSRQLDRMLGRLRPWAVVSNGNRTDDLCAMILARRRGIRSVFVSHGSFVAPQSDVERWEWSEQGRGFLQTPCDFLALQSPLAEGYLATVACPGRPIKTGPLIWGLPVERTRGLALARRLFGSRYVPGRSQVIVHAGTPKAGRNLRFYIYETADEYVQSISDLARAVVGCPDALLVVKFRPSPDITLETLRSVLPGSDRVLVSVQESFGEVLAMADLLVSFSSTTIEEALQNRIPVLLYGGAGRYQHVPGCAVRTGAAVPRAAVYHAVTLADLCSAVEGIVQAHGHRYARHRDVFTPYIYAEVERITLQQALRGMVSGCEEDSGDASRGNACADAALADGRLR